MPISTTVVLVVVLATCLAAGLSGLAARPGRRGGPGSIPPWWGALAVGLAYGLGHAGVATPSIPPADVTDRIPLIAIAGAAVAAALSRARDRFRARAAGSVALGALAYVVMLGPILGATDMPRETLISLATTALVATLAALNLAWLDEPARRLEVWVALTVLGLGAGVVLVLANSAILFQLGGILALVMAASLLGAWGRPIGGGIPVASAVLTALIIEGYFYAFMPTSSALLLAASPLAPWATRLGPLARLGPMAGAAASAGLIMLVVALAIGLILASKSIEGDPYPA